MAVKSIIMRSRVELAKRAHDCQANSSHRIEKGDVRLVIGEDEKKYCRDCALKIIEKGQERLDVLKKLEPEAD